MQCKVMIVGIGKGNTKNSKQVTVRTETMTHIEKEEQK